MGSWCIRGGRCERTRTFSSLTCDEQSQDGQPAHVLHRPDDVTPFQLAILKSDCRQLYSYTAGLFFQTGRNGLFFALRQGDMGSQ